MQTRVFTIDPHDPDLGLIKETVNVMASGGLVAFPTETVYGLGANADDPKALARLYAVKERMPSKPFALLVGSHAHVDKYAVDVIPAVYRLIDKFWPGPLTVVLKTKDSDTVGLRMPRSKVALAIARQATFGLACPSANLSSRREPLNAQDVFEDLSGKIDIVLDGGEVELGVVSTVVDGRKLPFAVLRKGSLEEVKIKQESAKKRVVFICTGNSCRSVMAQALFTKKLTEKARHDIEVTSAGIYAPVGMPATSEVQQLLKEEGIDVSQHAARRADEDLLKRCDLIFVMERMHERTLLERMPSLKSRVYLLKEFSKSKDGKLEIGDPIGQGFDVYMNCFSEIKDAVARLVDLV